MKTVKLTRPTQPPIVTVNEVTPDKYYGVRMHAKWSTEREVAFITQPSFRNGNYKTVAAHRLTVGNGYTHYEDPSLSNLVSKLIDGECEVFEFDTPSELFRWLADGK